MVSRGVDPCGYRQRTRELIAVDIDYRVDRARVVVFVMALSIGRMWRNKIFFGRFRIRLESVVVKISPGGDRRKDVIEIAK